jgi:hypothetical protein
VTEVAETAVTTPPNRIDLAGLISMLVAVVNALDDTWMSTRSPTARAAGNTVVEPSVKAVVEVMVYGVEVPS